MKNFTKIVGLIALVAISGFSLAGCMTTSSHGGTVEPHGLISGILPATAEAATQGATEIASFMVILNLINSGYEEYAQAVRAAVAQGRQVSSVTRNFIIFTRTTAYAR